MTGDEAERGPAVCPNGHAMDEGYFECPCCGAYRPSANATQPSPRQIESEYERQQRILRWYGS